MRQVIAVVEAKGQASRTPSGERSVRRSNALAWVGAALLGTVAMIWIGFATVGAYRICFPESYRRPGAAGSNTSGGWATDPSLADPRAACGGAFENVTLRRRDGLKLAAWFVPADKHAAIVLLHWAGGNRHLMLPFLKFIHAAGYPAMIVDEIDHGDSDDSGRGVGYGWLQRGDVVSAVAALKARGFAKVGALGVSQGAAAAILAQVQDHMLDAIVSDSSYGDLGLLIRHLPSIAQLNPLFVDTMLWESGFWLGRSPDRISPATAAAELGNCSLLVIQGGKDPIVPVSAGQAIYSAAPGSKEIWIVPEAGHGVFGAAPEEYARRVIAFFDRRLGESATPATGSRLSDPKTRRASRQQVDGFGPLTIHG